MSDSFLVDTGAVTSVEYKSLPFPPQHFQASRDVNLYDLAYDGRPIQSSDLKLKGTVKSGTDIAVSTILDQYYFFAFMDGTTKLYGWADGSAFTKVDAPLPGALLRPAGAPDPTARNAAAAAIIAKATQGVVGGLPEKLDAICKALKGLPDHSMDDLQVAYKDPVFDVLKNAHTPEAVFALDADTQYQFGHFYQCVGLDNFANQYLKNAATKGDIRAMKARAPYTDELLWLKKAAETGDAEAELLYATALEKLSRGDFDSQPIFKDAIRQYYPLTDPTQILDDSIHWYRAAAAQSGLFQVPARAALSRIEGNAPEPATQSTSGFLIWIVAPTVGLLLVVFAALQFLKRPKRDGELAASIWMKDWFANRIARTAQEQATRSLNLAEQAKLDKERQQLKSRIDARFPSPPIYRVPVAARAHLNDISGGDSIPLFREDCDDWWLHILETYPEPPLDDDERQARDEHFWKRYAAYFTITNAAGKLALKPKQDILDYFRIWEKWIFRDHYAATGEVNRTIAQEYIRCEMALKYANESITVGDNLSLSNTQKRASIEKAEAAFDRFKHETFPAHFEKWGGWFYFHVRETFDKQHSTNSEAGPPSATTPVGPFAHEDLAWRPTV